MLTVNAITANATHSKVSIPSNQAMLVLLSCPFGVFVLSRLNEFLHERHKFVIFIIECTDLFYIFA